MKDFAGQLRDAPYALAAMATVVLMSCEAGAVDTVGVNADHLGTQAFPVGKLTVAGAFIGGLVLLATGLLKLKQAFDTQGDQVKYSEGIWRVGVGAGLVAIAAFSSMLTVTFVTPAITFIGGGGQSF